MLRTGDALVSKTDTVSALRTLTVQGFTSLSVQDAAQGTELAQLLCRASWHHYQNCKGTYSACLLLGIYPAARSPYE